jgi:hypothetical protein
VKNKTEGCSHQKHRVGDLQELALGLPASLQCCQEKGSNGPETWSLEAWCFGICNLRCLP